MKKEAKIKDYKSKEVKPKQKQTKRGKREDIDVAMMRNRQKVKF